MTLVHPTCKRATVLHTEVCNQTDSSHYCLGSGYKTGDTITYGNLGTTGTLASGDAFDCDVNGDGVFDPATERFYYVSDLDTDSKYAVLIYYNNVSGGEPNNTKAYAYDSNSSPRENGPVTGKVELPTITQWGNVSLANTNRKIKDEKNTEYIDFSYQGYAARLLTYQEVNKACNNSLGINGGSVGALDNCKYLMENTQYTNNSLLYGYWLESVHSSYEYNSWNVYGINRNVYSIYSAGNADYYGVRPAIEVLKSKVSY